MITSEKAVLLNVNPVIPVSKMTDTITYYEEKLGFKNIYDSINYEEEPINYAVLCRDNMCFHFQLFESIKDFTMPMLRIRVQHLNSLFQEYKKMGLLDKKEIRKTPWGTSEFAFFDLNMVGLTFYEPID